MHRSIFLQRSTAYTWQATAVFQWQEWIVRMSRMLLKQSVLRRLYSHTQYDELHKIRLWIKSFCYSRSTSLGMLVSVFMMNMPSSTVITHDSDDCISILMTKRDSLPWTFNSGHQSSTISARASGRIGEHYKSATVVVLFFELCRCLVIVAVDTGCLVA